MAAAATDVALFGDSQHVDHEVDGQNFEFHPLSIKMLFKLRRMTGPLSRALSILFGANRSDCTVVERTFEASRDGPGGKEIVNEAISKELAQLRSRQQAQAAEELLSLVTDEEVAVDLAELIVDSLRDVFPRGDNKQRRTQAKALVSSDNTTVPRLIGLVHGLLKANLGALSPLGDRVRVLGERLGATPGETSATSS